MRDIFFILIIVGAIPFVFKAPRVGVLLWVWISVANPHKESFGWLYSFPVLDLIVAMTLLSCMANSKQLRLPKNNAIISLLVFYYLWCSLTTVFAVVPNAAFEKWLLFTKNMLLIVMIFLTHKTKKDIIAFAWVLVLSVAYTGVKGGLFTLLTLGGSRVWGPPTTAWGDNNGVSIVMLMLFPLTIALASTLRNKKFKYATLGTGILYVITVFGTHSRGGLLGLVAVVGLYIIRSKKFVRSGILVMIVGAFGLSFMPAHWLDRMGTIESHEDQSAQTRLVQWQYAINIANERPLFGNGYNSFFYDFYQNYFLADEIEENRNRAVHSIYFEVLGEQGYVGLIVFLLIGVLSIRKSNQLKASNLVSPEIRMVGYSAQFGLAGYAMNGVSVNMATLDIYYLLVVLACLCINQAIVSDK